MDQGFVLDQWESEFVSQMIDVGGEPLVLQSEVGPVSNLDRPLVDDEPVPVLRFWALLDDILEGEELRMNVVERSVEDDPDRTCVCLVDQLPQRLVASEHRIDGVIVGGVVAVIRGRAEDGVQVDDVNPEGRQVVESLGDPTQITALERPMVVGFVPGFLDIVSPLAPVVAIGEDLIDESSFGPAGHRQGRRWVEVPTVDALHGVRDACRHLVDTLPVGSLEGERVLDISVERADYDLPVDEPDGPGRFRHRVSADGLT